MPTTAEHDELGRWESYFLGAAFAILTLWMAAGGPGPAFLPRTFHIADLVLPLMTACLGRTAYTLIRLRRCSRAFALMPLLGVAAHLLILALQFAWL